MVREIDKRIREDAERDRSSWTHQGFLYKKVRDISDGIVVDCIAPGCGARLRVLGRDHYLEREHSHGPDEDLVKATEVEYLIKRRGLGKSAAEIERIFNDTCREQG